MRRSTLFLVAAIVAATAAPVPPNFPQDVLANMNLSADPCNDFYEYACGSWIAKTVLQPTEDVIFKSISTIQDANDVILTNIVANNSYAKIRPVYDNCVDRATINKLGTAPLQPYRNLNLNTLDEVAAFAGTLMGLGVNAFFTFSAVIDAMNPGVMIGEFDQGGFTLPVRDMYLSPSQLLTDYQSTVAKLFTLLDGNATVAAAKASAVIRVETALAQVALPADEIRDPMSTYHRSNLTNLNQVAPHFRWGVYFLSADISFLKTINIAEPAVLAAVDAYLASAPISDLVAYLDWQLLYNVASNYLLPDDFVSAYFAFFGEELNGETEMGSMSDFCVQLTNTYLGDLVSTYFIQQAFAGNSMTLATNMVDTIIGSFMNNLQNVSWMDPVTKAAAVAKENLLAHRVGYPANPNTYSDYNVLPGQHLATILGFQSTAFTDTVASQLGRPSNRNSWAMFADTVNAYYDAPTNSLTIPAGILQYPYFSAQNDPALNFAGSGVIIGHENSHGFDDQGREYDGNGMLKNWWLPQTLEQFEQRTSCMMKQYSSFQVLPGVYVNGNLTIGENIADNGGVKASYHAYLSTTATPNPQLFFVAYAQGWCSVATPEFLTNQVQTDVHSPAKFRAIGPLMNRPEFSQAFSCPVGSVMNPSTQCEVWMIRKCLVAFGGFVLVLTAGLPYGWTSMEPLLVRQGYFDHGDMASRQNHLATVAMLGLFASNGFALFASMILDCVGPALTNFMCLLVFFAGAMVLGWNVSVTCGWMLMACGGSGIFAASLRLAYVFPKDMLYSVIGISMAFDSSVVVPTVLNYVNKNNLIDDRALFGGLGFLALLLVSCLITLWFIYYKIRRMEEADGEVDDEFGAPETQRLYYDDGFGGYGTRSQRGLSEVSLPNADNFHSMHSVLSNVTGFTDKVGHQPNLFRGAHADADTPELVGKSKGKDGEHSLLLIADKRMPQSRVSLNNLTSSINSPAGKFSKTLMASPQMQVTTSTRLPSHTMDILNLTGRRLSRDEGDRIEQYHRGSFADESRQRTESATHHDEDVALSDYDRPDTTVSWDTASAATSSANIPLSERRILKQLSSYEFVFTVLFAVVNTFHTAWFVSATPMYLIELGDATGYYASVIGAITSAELLLFPAVTWFFRHFTLWTATITTTTLGMIHAILCCVRVLPVQVAAAVVFIVYRAIAFSSLYTLLFVVFGRRNVSKLTGLVRFVSSFLICAQPALASYSSDGTTSQVQYVHIALVIVMAVMFGICLWLRGETQNPDVLT